MLSGCQRRDPNAVLRAELEHFAADKDARIGIAVIINGTDTIMVNGYEDFPMLSVYKFPQSLAIADFCKRYQLSFTDSVDINADEIKLATWSPMRDNYGVRNLRLPIAELLAYTLQQSDNNACDILFRLIGSPAVADSLMHTLGFTDIHILSTEDEMHLDTSLCYANSATPIEMARLIDHFNSDLRQESPLYEQIAELMENCRTGTDRLARPLTSANVIFGHKTGTGDVNSEGRIIAINDVGYVNQTNNFRYSIAVFISDSASDMETTSQMIAEISEIVFNYVSDSYRGDTIGLN